MSRLPWGARIAVAGFLAWFSAGLSIWAFGTSWWSLLIAAICVAATMAPALREPPPGGTDG